jgi:hypothetical protein
LVSLDLRTASYAASAFSFATVTAILCITCTPSRNCVTVSGGWCSPITHCKCNVTSCHRRCVCLIKAVCSFRDSSVLAIPQQSSPFIQHRRRARFCKAVSSFRDSSVLAIPPAIVSVYSIVSVHSQGSTRPCAQGPHHRGVAAAGWLAGCWLHYNYSCTLVVPPHCVTASGGWCSPITHCIQMQMQRNILP